MDTPRLAVVSRWHELRRVAGLVAVALAVISGIILSWPAMVIVGVLGAAGAVDATIALRTGRTSIGPTLIADISLSGIGLAAVAVPPPAIGMVVAYYVLVLAVLGTSIKVWPIGLYAVVVGVAASVVPVVLGLDYSIERSLISGVIVVAVFGLSIIAIAAEFLKVRSRGKETIGRRIEVADAVASASMALVAEDESRALASALEAVRSAMGVTVVFAERNVEDPDLGISAVVVDRSADGAHTHASLDLQSKVPWSSMPGARAHLEGGAPFFYRVEESRGTRGDRGGDGGLRVEVNVPIVMDGSWIGVIGAADANPEQIWRTDDLVLLRTMADLTAAFWQRARNAKVRDSLIGSLDGRLRYEEAIAKASRALLGEQAGGVGPALHAVGEAVHVDEVVVTSTESDEKGDPIARVLDSWVSPGLDAIVAAEDTWSYRNLEGIRDALQRGEIAHDDIDDVCRFVAGIEVEGAWFGSVGFFVGTAEREWTDRDRAFLRTIADMLGAFYERARNRTRLQESLDSKDQLIASVSHELRTPLTAVGGLAEELLSAGEALGAEDRDQLLEVIASESMEMADLIEDLLVAARSQDGALPVFPESVDLALLTKTTLSHVAVPDGTIVNVHDVPSVGYADPVRVRQIIRNLLTNAFRYGGTTVTVSFGEQEGEAWVDVHDNGNGIPESDWTAIFEAYGRSRTGAEVKASVGLGLTLSRRLSALMGGSLNYMDGDGCTFRLSVPVPSPEGDRSAGEIS